MTLLMTEHVIPYLKHHLRNDITILYRTIRTTGIGESKLAELLDPVLGSLENPVVAYLPGPKGVDIRLTVKGTNQKELKEKIQNIENRIISLAAEYVYGFDDDTLEKIVGELLRRHNLTIAVAESCTGGLIGHRLTEIPGSSDYFDQAIVAYSNRAKIELLGVKPETLETFGAVSEQTTQEMAEGIRKTSTCDIGAATTGIAGPTGGTPQKPVGLVYIAIADKFDTITKQLNLYGERSRIKIQASQALLNLLRKHLNEKY
jgi:nicotinamide-nucleotide amidase